jgi:uncharacterized membrane protein
MIPQRAMDLTMTFIVGLLLGWLSSFASFNGRLSVVETKIDLMQAQVSVIAGQVAKQVRP